MSAPYNQVLSVTLISFFEWHWTNGKTFRQILATFQYISTRDEQNMNSLIAVSSSSVQPGLSPSGRLSSSTAILQSAAASRVSHLHWSYPVISMLKNSTVSWFRTHFARTSIVRNEESLTPLERMSWFRVVDRQQPQSSGGGAQACCCMALMGLFFLRF